MKKFPVLKSLQAMDSYAFLMKELEKLDPVIQEPLTGTDWPRDMPVVTGGGLMENIRAIDVTYASTGMSEDNIIGDDANNIPVINAEMSDQVARCFNWAEYMSISMLEKEKMDNIGRDLQAILDKGIRLHADKTLDRNAYVGFYKTGSVGLCNNPNIVRVAAARGASNSTRWESKTADEILNDINAILSALWEDNDCSTDAYPNHILIPVEQFGMLATRKASSDSIKSILTYVQENNIVTQAGGNLVISPCKWCTAIGQDNVDRLVCYSNREDRICFNLTQPLRRLENENTELRIKIPFIMQFSEVRFKYTSTVRYMDGI